MTAYEFELISGAKLPHLSVLVNDITFRNYHLHGAFEILLDLAGEGQVHLPSEALPVRTGSLLLINPNEAHEIEARGDHLILLIFQVSRHFCRDYLPHLSSTRFLRHDLTAADHAQAIKRTLLDASVLYLREPPDFAYGFLSSTLRLFQLLTTDVPHETLSDRDRSALRKRVQRLNRILDYMESNYQAPIRLKDLADAEQLTETYVSHLFTEQLGVSFHTYLNNLRFERAVAILHNPAVSVSEAALQSGFSDPKYLNQMMRRRMGCSASGYRKGREGETDQPVRSKPSLPLERYLAREDALRTLEAAREGPEISFHD